MKDTAGGPARDADVGEHDVKGAQRVRGGDGVADFVEAVDVGPEVGGGEEDGDGLLHAKEAGEGPFAVELDDGLVRGDAGGGDYALAGVVAFRGAIPEEEAVVEGFLTQEKLVVSYWDMIDEVVRREEREMLTDGCLRFAWAAIFLLAYLYRTSVSAT